MSIRARLTIAIALVFLVTVAVLGTVAVRTTRATLVDQLDDQVRDYSDRTKGLPRAQVQPSRDWDDSPDYGVTPGHASERSEFARLVYLPNGDLVDIQLYGYADQGASPPDCPKIPSPELDAVLGKVITLPSLDGTLTYRTLIVKLEGGLFQAVAAPLTGVDEAVNDLVGVVLGFGAISVTTAIAMSWWVIRQGLKPVDHMVATAAAVAEGDMSARIERPDPATELGRLGTALNDMMGKIETANNARDAGEQRLRRFVADAAHELRTPLTSLRGYAELYRQGALPDAVAVGNAMSKIESEGARMSRLVDDLLLLARLDQARGVEQAPVDLGEIVTDAVEDFRVVAPDRPVALDLAAPVVVAGDRLRLRQVVDNLLTNARTHTPAGTDISVSVTNGGGEAILTVADTGPGIALEDQERIFERFWRADRARSRSRGGTGLGLAIVASLVHAHNGRVDLESEPGHGASFIIHLPLAEPA